VMPSAAAMRHIATEISQDFDPSSTSGRICE
jgi:hypothetical protein